MLITVKHINGMSYDLKLTENYLIKDFKRAMEKLFLRPIKVVKARGRELNDELTLKEARILNGMTLEVG
jgi:uncharacterized ubiquitin-like protein YukD